MTVMSEWYIYRDGGIDIEGSWVPGTSWSGYRKLNDVLRYRIEILGIYKSNSFGCKPRRWCSYLELNGLRFNIKTTHPSCKSIKDACRLADKFLTDDILLEAYRYFVSKTTVTCIFKDGRQFLSFFGQPKWDSKIFPNGEYEVHGKTYLSHIEKHWHGWRGQNRKEEFERWV